MAFEHSMGLMQCISKSNKFCSMAILSNDSPWDSRVLDIWLTGPRHSPELPRHSSINQHSFTVWNHCNILMLDQETFQARYISSFFIISESKKFAYFHSILVAATTDSGFENFNLTNRCGLKTLLSDPSSPPHPGWSWKQAHRPYIFTFLIIYHNNYIF